MYEEMNKKEQPDAIPDIIQMILTCPMRLQYDIRRDRMLESWEWLEVECDCDNLTICQNHRDIAEVVGIDPLDLVGINW
jgi:hypothetical protein